MRKKMMILGAVMLLGGAFGKNNVLASTLETEQLIEEISLNMEKVDFEKLKMSYSDEEIIDIITEEVNDSMTEFEDEVILDLNTSSRSLPTIKEFNVETPSGYNYTVTSVFTPQPNLRGSGSESGYIKYNSTYTHQIKTTTPLLVGSQSLHTTIATSPGKISAKSVNAYCVGGGLYYCDQGQKDAWSENYTMPGTYSSFATRGVYVYRVEASVAGSIAAQGSIYAKYGCTAYDNVNQRVTVKATWSY